MTNNNALFIGRFQPFHKGHLSAIKTLSKDYDTVIIGIGSAQYNNTLKNPFSGEERRKMIDNSLKSVHVTNYSVVLIDDLHDHSRWVQHVVSFVPPFSIVFTNDSLTMNLFRKNGYTVKEINYLNRKEYMGTEIRKRIKEKGDWENLVPKEVVDIIKEIDGINRIKNCEDENE